MWELSQSLRLLLYEGDQSPHATWLRQARSRVDADLLRLLAGLMPNPQWYPDFLSPSPGTRPRLLSTELRHVSTMTADDIALEMKATYEGAPSPELARLLDRPDAGRHLRDALETYWDQALARHWPRIKRVLTADLSLRADALAANGLHDTLNTLHHQVSFDGKTLSLDLPSFDADRRGDSEGLALLPCVFAAPRILVVAAEPHPITVAYPPRGAATIWFPRAEQPVAAASALLGRSRTNLLLAMERPTSAAELAEVTGLSAPAVSQHLAVLRRTGLVESRKSGRTVWSVRTELASQLLAACTT